jgi:cell division septation protein DedD
VPRNEEGEFELVLANRQLLSVFFIVVILLGVFFTMGYIVGRSSAPLTTAETTPPRSAETKPLVVDSTAPAAEAPAESPKQPITTATQQPSESKPAPKSEVKSEQPKAALAKSEPPKSEPTDAAKAAKGDPATGETYLQLVATARAEADVMVDVLKKKGFHAIESPVPNKEGWMRVLVGPIADGAVNKIRADLESSGFPGDKAIKKTF